MINLQQQQQQQDIRRLTDTGNSMDQSSQTATDLNIYM